MHKDLIALIDGFQRRELRRAQNWFWHDQTDSAIGDLAAFYLLENFELFVLMPEEMQARINTLLSCCHDRKRGTSEILKHLRNRNKEIDQGIENMAKAKQHARAQ